MVDRVFHQRDTAIKRALVAALTLDAGKSLEVTSIGQLVKDAMKHSPNTPPASFRPHIGNLIREKLVDVVEATEFDGATASNGSSGKPKSFMHDKVQISTTPSQRENLLKMVRLWDRNRARGRSGLVTQR